MREGERDPLNDRRERVMKLVAGWHENTGRELEYLFSQSTTRITALEAQVEGMRLLGERWANDAQQIRNDAAVEEQDGAWKTALEWRAIASAYDRHALDVACALTTLDAERKGE